MPVENITPSLDLLTEEYVLVQAWKKASGFIRSHNWYADTLALDRATVNLPRFLQDLSVALSAPSKWENGLLRIVPAPKSQHWRVDKANGLWSPVPLSKKPENKDKSPVKLRPLAHVSFRD